MMVGRVTLQQPRIEVWAQLFLCGEDCLRVQKLLVSEAGVKRGAVIRGMHLTVYHARRFMPGLAPTIEPVRLVVPTNETRFMVLAPGGENPRPELEPRHCKVGIRIQRRNSAHVEIQAFRNRLLAHETPNVLGGRHPSTKVRNAFGARNFQPHVAFLRSGSRIDRDLTKVGVIFRRALQYLTFDRFSIDVVKWDCSGNRIALR
jgi:hypothetical protein